MAEIPDNKQTSFWDKVKTILKRVWEYLKEAKMEYIIMLSLFALDIISKIIINATTDVGQTVVVIPYFINFTNVHNYNAAFGSDWIKNGLGSIGARILFSIIAVAASVVFIIILIKNRGGSKLSRIGLALLTAGAMGNCVDRMIYGYVRDFIEFVYFGLEIFGSRSFYVFNIADSGLVVGVVLVLVYFIFFYREKNAVPEANAGGTAAQSEATADAGEQADASHAQGESGSAEDDEHSEGKADIGALPESSPGEQADANTAEHDARGGETDR